MLSNTGNDQRSKEDILCCVVITDDGDICDDGPVFSMAWNSPLPAKTTVVGESLSLALVDMFVF